MTEYDEIHDEIPTQLKAYGKRAAQALNVLALGRTVDDIAEVLRALDIKGKRTEADSCPLARYVRQQVDLPKVYGFTVYRSWNLQRGSMFSASIGGDTPDNLYEFAQKFDALDYPDLIEA